ncbi:DUF5819 family protein [Streptomyces sp. 4N509B]|uniref:DUF5819 family protein n=1 Tax=Streptomyces sp. 4N509B TaxID=3457413 RepID=UPI003FCEF246
MDQQSSDQAPEGAPGAAPGATPGATPGGASPGAHGARSGAAAAPPRDPSAASGPGSDPDPGSDLGSDLDRTATADVRLGALSLPARIIVALTVGALTIYAAAHMVMVFLFVAPENHVTQEYGDGMREYIYPEFEQSWKLFAPNPLQRNVAVEVRAETRDGEGGRDTTDWISLTAMDVENIEHNPWPSHTAQNELRRAWDFYTGSHTETGGEAVGLRGELSEIYVHRIALLRLDQSGLVDVDDIVRIQLRSATTLVPAPEWRAEDLDTSTAYYELDWWVVTSRDLPSGVLAPDDDDQASGQASDQSSGGGQGEGQGEGGER